MEQSSVGNRRDSYRGMSSDNVKGLVLALSSSFFIGASCIVKKKGLKKAGSSGVRAVPRLHFVWNSGAVVLKLQLKFLDWDRQNLTQIVTEMCGFMSILFGTFFLYKTKDTADDSSLTSIQMSISKHSDKSAYDPECVPLRRQDNICPS